MFDNIIYNTCQKKKTAIKQQQEAKGLYLFLTSNFFLIISMKFKMAKKHRNASILKNLVNKEEDRNKKHKKI